MCEHWYLQRPFLAFLDMVILILPPCLVMQIDKLKYISAVAAVAIFSVIGVTIYEYFDTPDILFQVPDQLVNASCSPNT